MNASFSFLKWHPQISRQKIRTTDILCNSLTSLLYTSIECIKWVNCGGLRIVWLLLTPLCEQAQKCEMAVCVGKLYCACIHAISC
jgi:hypothetical protein